MNPTKNLIDPKLYIIPYQVFSGVHVKFKFYEVFSGDYVKFTIYQVFTGVHVKFRFYQDLNFTWTPLKTW
jgi:hypothetical protein